MGKLAIMGKGRKAMQANAAVCDSDNVFLQSPLLHGLAGHFHTKVTTGNDLCMLDYNIVDVITKDAGQTARSLLQQLRAKR